MGVRIRIENRPIWVLIPFILSLLPFSYAIREGESAGAGADVVNTIWAMWWFQQEWSAGGWGGTSTLFNFPFGGSGAILSPINAVIWSFLDVVVGPAWASTLCSIICLYGTMLLLIAIARIKSWSSLSIGSCLLTFLCTRYFLFTLGETGVVGVAIWPLLLCWYASLCFLQKSHWKWICLIFVGIALQGLENPYLAPIPPCIVLFLLWGNWKQLGFLLTMGLLGILVIGSLYHGTSASEYQSLRPSYWLQFLGQYFPVVERSWARISMEELFFPQRIRWPIGGQDTIHQAGRGFLGYSVLLFSLLGVYCAKRERWLLLFLLCLGIIFSLGSDFGGHAAPFAWFNSICATWVRALTQPTRYLLLAILGLVFLVGFAMEYLIKDKGKRGLACAGWLILLLEGMTWGGLSLRLPYTEIPEERCIRALSHEEGGVLVWPWDGIDDEDFDATLYSRLFQMVHNRPAATIGTGSWPVVGKVFPGEVLRDLEEGGLEIAGQVPATA